jgi:hypothetical protein
MEWHMLRLLNKDRKNHGLPGLFMQDDLRDVARKHSRDMARKDYFSHTNHKGKSPSDRLKKARVTDAVSGENLAKIGGFMHPTVRAEIGLMNSPGHRANILNEAYNCVGIGVIRSSTKINYYTQNFAKRELIFNDKPKKKSTLKKGLKLEGKSIRGIKEIVVEVSQLHKKKEIHRIPVQNKKFKTTLPFPAIGRYTIKIYTKHGKKYLMANSFEMRIQKNWWG